MHVRCVLSFAVGVVLGAWLISLSGETPGGAPARPPPRASRLRGGGGSVGTGRRRRHRPPDVAAAEPDVAALDVARPPPAVADGARTHGPFYGDLETPGEFDRAVRLVSRRGELVLLHGDANRMRMLVNLIANLNRHEVYHVLLLGFSNRTCARLQVRRRIGCAHSSYMEVRGAQRDALSEGLSRWQLDRKYVAWIQKFHYMRKLVEARVNVLALDSDVVVAADPYPHLHGAFRSFGLVTAFDTKGGFANINVGVVYLQNASLGGPVHGLFVEFERRVALALAMPVPASSKKRAQAAVRFFWDQNLFNKVLLSALAGHAVYLPDDSDAAWTKAHADHLWQSARPESYSAPAAAVRTPGALLVRPPWFPAVADFRWKPLAPAAGSGAPVENVLLAPPWLISADNALGHRYKHWLYGARPAPCVMLHFVCVASGEGSRLLPMDLFGYWDEASVQLEVPPRPAPPQLAAAAHAPAKPAREPAPAGARAPAGVVPGRRPLLALADATLDSPMAPRPWGSLNALHAVLGGLALASGRTPVMTALNCSGVVDSFLEPGKLPSRCFWHVHTPRGVACVFRVGKCIDKPNLLASPTELRRAVSGAPRAPPVVALSLRAPTTEVRAAVDALLREHAAAPVVLLRLTLPTPAGGGAGHKLIDRARELATAALPALGGAMRRFEGSCSELTDRSKRKKRECTNVC